MRDEFVRRMVWGLSGVFIVWGALPPRTFAEEAPAAIRTEEGVSWYEAKSLGLEGQGFEDVAAPYDRLPARAEELVRGAVWGLSRHSAGLAVRFVTDAPEIRATWTLTSSRLDMPHMPSTGVSGLDLYVLDDAGTWRWLANGRPGAQENSQTLVSGLPVKSRHYLLYLPLYNGVKSVQIGIPEASVMKAAPAWASGLKPIVFYGTSITQGGCASRPGMVHTAILGRRLQAPVINLGFSGNGRMEPEVARLMAEIDASLFVIDCLPNIGASEVTARTREVVDILREAHPDVPILLVEDRSYTDSFLLTGKRQRNLSSRAALKEEYEKLLADGVKGVHYLEGENLIGLDGEGTVDSSHPTDLGFWRQADAFEAAIRPILE